MSSTAVFIISVFGSICVLGIIFSIWLNTKPGKRWMKTLD
jgi:hypothetical protein